MTTVENKDKAKFKRQYLQLSRLERLTDVVYAIVLWRIFMLIPRPGVSEEEWSSVSAYLSDNVMALVLVIIGVAVTIIYWLQNNILFGNLEKTDGRHTALSILQVFCLLIFLYSLRLGIEMGASPATRAFESASAALLGITAGWAWTYAIKNRRLLLPEVTDEEALALRARFLAEPITAIITLPFSFTPILWEVSWLSYPVIVKLLRRRRQASAS